MLLKSQYCLALILLSTSLMLCATERPVSPSPNAISFPKDYPQWSVLGISHRTDNQSLRLILGNAIAQKAQQEGKTKPWPEGAMLGKVVWKDSEHPAWTTATIPGALKYVEFMLKDSQRFKTTGGWGFARWLGKRNKPYGKNAGFAKECYQCHLKVKNADLVFTKSIKLP